MDPIVSVTQGRVRGSEKDGVLSFKGIPYAAPPFGIHRFACPAPAAPWDGVRDALEYGPTAPKPMYGGAMAGLLPDLEIPGQDCLNLNIWTPAADSAHRPVLVWIHGGAFVYGSGSLSVYDGSKFARDGIVCVTINYRLGVDGFLLIDGAPANRGLLDQIAALGWVRDNIEAFGGDPDAVTIAGESAGAMSVTTLLTMPTAAGLFRRAIAQSGAGHHVIGSDNRSEGDRGAGQATRCRTDDRGPERRSSRRTARRAGECGRPHRGHPGSDRMGRDPAQPDGVRTRDRR